MQDAPILPISRRMRTDPDYIASYIAHRVSVGDWARSTAEQKRPMLRLWHRYAGDDPTAWTADQAGAWVHDDRLRPASRKSRLGTLRPYMRWLVEEEIIERDICSRLARVVVPPGPPRDFEPHEVRAIITCATSRRDRLIVLLMAHMGLRCGDVARIRIEDIDPRRRDLHVRGKNGRGEVTHSSPIPSSVWTLMERHLRSEGRGRGPLLRSLTTGGALRPDSVGDIVADLIDQAGLKLYPGDGRTPHALRHTFATGLVDDGADLRLAQHALGHRTIRSTELYVRREPAGLRDAMEGLAYQAA